MGAIGAGTGLAGEEISDYMDDGKIDNTDQSYLGTAAGGFVTGALIPVGGTEAVGLKGIATQAAKNGLAGMVGNTVQQQISTGKVDEKEVLETGVVSGVLTGAAYGIGGSLKSSVVNNASEDLDNTGLNQETVDKILSTPKGQRPDPSTYLSEDYINEHLSNFQDGVTKIKSKAPVDIEGVGLGTFVMPKSVADDVINQAGADVSKLEKLLGLNPGDLGTNPVRVDIANPQNIRIPSGNEAGAWPGYWTPGGYTKPGGVMEAVIDPVPKSNYVVTDNILGR